MSIRTEQNSRNTIIQIMGWALAVTTVIALCCGCGILESFGFGLFSISFLRVAIFQDRPFMLQWLMVLVASLQWIVAPSLMYHGSLDAAMYVSQDDYMSFAVPGTVAFFVGLFGRGSQIDRRAQLLSMLSANGYVRHHPYVPVVLVALSLCGTIALHYLPPSVFFLAYLLSNLKYAAVMLMMFTHRRDRKIWLFVIVGAGVLEAAATSLIHDALLWVALCSGAYVFAAGMSARAKVLLFICLVVAGTIVQSVKADYRGKVWSGGEEAAAGTFLAMSKDRVFAMLSGEATIADIYGSLISRLNQGWIISRIIFYIPDSAPYASGETIIEGAVAALVPRLIVADKAMAGGQKTFERLTGLHLSEGTSMGASVLGEAYGNFGRLGGIIFMAAYGFGIALVLSGIANGIQGHPLFNALLPCVFLQVIKAETDFVTVANYLAKSLLAYWLVFYLLSTVFKYYNVRGTMWRAHSG